MGVYSRKIGGLEWHPINKLYVKNKMETLSIILVIIFIISVIAWLFNWSQTCSFLKEPNALVFYLWTTVFFPEKFKPEGEKYRKKTLIFLLLQFSAIIVFFIINEK